MCYLQVLNNTYVLFTTYKNVYEHYITNTGRFTHKETLKSSIVFLFSLCLQLDNKGGIKKKDHRLSEVAELSYVTTCLYTSHIIRYKLHWSIAWTILLKTLHFMNDRAPSGLYTETTSLPTKSTTQRLHEAYFTP